MKRILLLTAFLFTHFFIHAQNITIEWDKTFGGDQFDNSAQLIATPDGGYLVAGSSDSNISDDKSENSKGSYDLWALKLDSNGNKVWDKTLGGSEFDAIGDVTLTGDGGYLLVGHSNSSASGDKTGNSRGSTDGWVIKLDGNGVVQWDKTIGGSGADYLNEVLSIPGGGYLLGGYSESTVSGEKSQNSKGSFDYWIIKIDENGTILWDRTLGGEAQETLIDLIATGDGGFLLAGNSPSSNSGDKSESSRGQRDYWIVRVDQEGHYLWDKTYGGALEDLLTSVLLTDDGSFILAGNSNSAISGEKSENANVIDYWVLKIDAAGNLLWDKTIGGNNRDWNPFLCPAPDGGGFLLAGGSDSGIGADKSEASRGQIDYWVVKIDEQGNKIWDKTLGGNSDDSISSIISTGSGFLLGGSSNSGISGEKTESNHNFYSDLWIVKMSDATPSISGFTLINAETDEDILTLTDGAEINLTDLPTTLLNIRANTTGNTSSVLLEISGALTNSRSEGVAPYALYGDSVGDYNSQEFIPGDYTLTATPFSGSSPGTPLSVQFSIVETAAPAPFVTTWKTDNPGVSDDNQITIPTFPEETYNYTVDWNDGTIDTNVTGDITHTYAAPGIYQVSITGMFPRIYHEILDGVLNDSEKLLSVDQWGEQVWMSMEKAFAGCTNMDVLATDVPDLSQVNTMENMFSYCFSLVGNASFSQWNVSSVTNMSALFFENYLFNQDIGDWNVSNLVEASGMFAGAESFNEDIGAWNVSGIQYMGGMFNGATVFNQDISNWDVSNVTNFNNTFARTSFFNQDLSNWNVGNAIIFAGMFSEAIAFDQNISSWNVAKAVRMEFMFDGATSFNADISSWDVSRVTSMKAMFRNALVFNQDIGSWDVSKVTTMENMFANNALSKDNYDNTLIGWGNLPGLQNSVPFHAGNSIYCNGEVSRLRLIEDYGWIITDAGKDCPFITTWKTDNPGTSATNQVTIPTNQQFVYNYNVNWGDGSSDTGVNGDITHSYTNPGTYTVEIQGEFPQLYFNNEGDKEKLVGIDQWGDISWNSMENAFYGCSNMELNASDIPDFSQVQSTQHMFHSCGSMQGHSSMSAWDMSNVTAMDFMFREASEFNQDISGWDVSQVNTMMGMFAEAHAFNSPLSSWNVTKVANMERMFSNALVFNQPIGNWDVGALTNMAAMFFGAKSFNQDIGNWNVSNVQNMIFTFGEAIAFNQDLSAWDLSSAVDISFMFANAESFNNDISQWNTSNIRYMNNVFSWAVSFDQNLSSWDVSSVESMSEIFNRSGLSQKNYDAVLNGWTQINNLQSGVTMGAGTITYCTGADARQNLIDSHGWVITDGGEDCPGILPFVTTWKTDNPGISEDNQITVPTYPGETYNYTVDWGDGTSDTGVSGDIMHTYDSPGTYQVSIVGDFPRIYFNNVVLGFPEPGDEQKIISVDQWGAIQWSSMLGAFAGCSNLDVLAIDTPDLSMVSDMTGMFRYCETLVGNSTFNEWDLSSVTQMGSLFEGASLFNQDIGAWNVSNVVYMSFLFSAATNFNQNISSWDTGNVEYMAATFSSATSFNQDIGNWNVSKVKEMHATFAGATSFNQDIGAWDLSSTNRTDAMFSGATSFNQNISSWDVSNVTTFNVMFYNAVSFDQNLGNWDVSNVVDMAAMFESAGMSLENYDKLLLGWSSLPTLNSGVSFNAGNSQFCESADARQNLINTYGWEVTDGGKNCPGDGAFITTWKTDNPGYSEDNQIKIPTHAGVTYDYIVDWGDGTSDSGVTGDITHTYATPGTYQVSISGTFPRIFFLDNDGTDDVFPDREKILSIDQWGSIQWQSMDSAFGGCYNLDMLATDVPDLSQVTSLAGMFNACPSLVGNDSFREWDVSTIVNMAVMFAGTNLFNMDIGNWDVSNVRWMSAMFLGALSFNQDIGSWNVGNVTGMSSMFLNAQSFNQDLSVWDVGNVTHMSSMFQMAISFNQPLGSWNVSKVSDMTNMFSGVTLSLEHYDNLLNGWANLPSLQNGIAFHGGNSEFCQAVEAHQKLIGKYGWAITDGGTECPGPGLTITGLVLVDADTNQDIMPLTHGLLVYVGSLPTMNLNIRAETTDDTSSVSLALAGAIGASRTENVAPFALFGDSAGDYYAELFETGSYTMTATPYSDKNLGGTEGNALSVSFEITDSTPDCNIFRVTSSGVGRVTNCNQPDGYATVVVSGATGPVSYSWSHDPNLNGPEAFNLSPGNYTLTYSDDFCSKEITFEVDALLPEVNLGTFEDVPADAAPFALTGGFPEGGIYSGTGVSDGMFDPAVGTGAYEITYTYTNDNGCSNSAVQYLTVQAATSLSVTGFVLVDADTDQDILTLTNDMVIDMTSLPTANLNIRASTTEDVQSVRLELDGQETYGRTESTAPYALYGDNSGNYNGHVYTPGNYTLTVTPYSGNGLSGTQGTTGSINFTFISGGSGKGNITFGTKGYEVSLAPNSASTSVNVSLTDSSVKIRSILVHDLSGRKVGEFNAPDYLQGTDYVLPVYQFQTGIYIITTVDSEGAINQERLSVQN